MTDEQPKKRGRGRPKGSLNKLSKANIELVSKDGGLTPLEYLTRVYQNESEETKTRVDAAKSAAPYVHPKLNAVQVEGDVALMSHEEWIKKLS